MTKILSVLLVVVLAGVGVLGDYFIKLAGNGPRYINYSYFFTGLIVYALTAFGWFYVMKHLDLSLLGIFYSLTTVTLLFVIGTSIFKEHINGYEVVGIILGVISIILLSRFA